MKEDRARKGLEFLDMTFIPTSLFRRTQDAREYFTNHHYFNESKCYALLAAMEVLRLGLYYLCVFDPLYQRFT